MVAVHTLPLEPSKEAFELTPAWSMLEAPPSIMLCSLLPDLLVFARSKRCGDCRPKARVIGCPEVVLVVVPGIW